MAEPISSKLHLWDGWAASPGRAGLPAHEADRQPAESSPADAARRLFLQEGLLSQLRRRKELPEAFTYQWFLEVEEARHGRHGRWLPRLLEFHKHAGDRLLGLGPCLGTDWAGFARHGAEVVACSPSAEQLALVQRNFQLRGLRVRCVHASPAALPLDSTSIDVACVTSLLIEPPDPHAVIAEVYRVLKPGGKVLALAPAAYDVDYWCRGWLPWVRESQLPRPVAFGTAPGQTGRSLRRLFERFHEASVWRRQLRRQDLPHLLRWFPLALLERGLGRFLVLKAFKPVSVAIPLQAAA